MVIYIRHLWIIIAHKYYVMIECFRVGIPILGILHDWTKILPIEFFPQAMHGRGELNRNRDKTGYYRPWFGIEKVDRSLHHHVTNNKHHWQYWIMNVDSNNVEPIRIPEKYLREMVCDWIGTNKVRGHVDYMERCRVWYLANRSKLVMHPVSSKYIRDYFGIGEKEDV